LTIGNEWVFRQWKGLSNIVTLWGLILFVPFSNLAVDWLEEIGVKQYKIGSGEITNFLILEKIAQTGKPVNFVFRYEFV
jgi:N-acetylneuraminate synthase